MKRIISLILAMLMLTFAFVSCDTQTNSNETEPEFTRVVEIQSPEEEANPQEAPETAPVEKNKEDRRPAWLSSLLQKIFNKNRDTEESEIPKDAVAAIGSVYYDSLEEAISSARDGETIYIMKDCDDENVLVSSAVFFTINSQGYSFNISAGEGYTLRTSGNSDDDYLSAFTFTKAKPVGVYYSDFGAVGDGITDDYDAIVAAHDYANQHGLPVFADEGATYYIGESDKCAIIRTNTTWTGATFIIDDRKLVPWKSDINTLFLVDGDEYVDDFEIDSLKKGQKRLNFAPGEKLLVTVENDNIRQYFRRYVNYDASTAMSDTFVVDEKGNILSDIIWNFDEITKTTAKRIGEPLVIEGGTFLHKVNRHNSQSYFSRNIKIIRSNTTVQNLTMKVADEGNVGSPYMGFLTIIETAYVNLKNLKLDAYNSFGGTMGTYAMQINYSANTTLDNVIQTNDILDESRWGIMNTNFCKDFVVKNSKLNRYDSHMGVTNCTIENSTIGRNGVNLIGHGDFILKDSTVYNDCLFILRADYGATWDGDIYVENVDWYHSSSCPSVIYARNDSQHDFGYTCYQPHNLYIDGLDIYEYNAPAGKNYPRILCYYVRGEEIGTVSPYVLCERVVVNDLNTESGIPTYLSFNEGDYPDTEWVITNSNVIEDYLPRD